MDKKAKKSFNFKGKKESTLCSLYEVEYFLRNLKKIFNSIKLYKILK